MQDLHPPGGVSSPNSGRIIVMREKFHNNVAQELSSEEELHDRITEY